MHKQALLLVAATFLLTVLLPAQAETQVYITRDADGNPIFSDRRSQNAEEHVVTELPSMPAFKVKTAQALDSNKASESTGATYTSLNIVSPASGTNIENGYAGDVEVSGVLSPGLGDGDKIVLKDGEQVIATNTQTSFMVKNLSRGEHTLSMHVINSDGDVKISSQPVTIYVQRSSSLAR